MTGVTIALVLLGLMPYLSAVSEDEFNLLKNENKNLKDELRQIQLRLSDTADLGARVQHLEDDVIELQLSDAAIIDRLEVLETAITEPSQVCTSAPCENGATCVEAKVDVFICLCVDGFFGLTCENSFADASFFASLEADGGVGEPIIFTNEIINPGGHYNSATGEYTVPYNGTYMFSVHLQTVVSADVIGLQIAVDGSLLYADTTVDEPDRSTTLITQLTAGQVVSANNVGDTVSGQEDVLRSFFFGYLIYAS